MRDDTRRNLQTITRVATVAFGGGFRLIMRRGALLFGVRGKNPLEIRR